VGTDAFEAGLGTDAAGPLAGPRQMPQRAPAVYPDQDLFIQRAKLTKTLPWLMGEDQITHLGMECYQGLNPNETRSRVCFRPASALVCERGEGMGACKGFAPPWS
jgi:hypothetical protein